MFGIPAAHRHRGDRIGRVLPAAQRRRRPRRALAGAHPRTTYGAARPPHPRTRRPCRSDASSPDARTPPLSTPGSAAHARTRIRLSTRSSRSISVGGCWTASPRRATTRQGHVLRPLHRAPADRRHRLPRPPLHRGLDRLQRQHRSHDRVRRITSGHPRPGLPHRDDEPAGPRLHGPDDLPARRAAAADDGEPPALGPPGARRDRRSARAARLPRLHPLPGRQVSSLSEVRASLPA